jgi:hypothetical protein
MITVHKQRLVVTDVQTLSLPFDAEPLCVQEQFGEPCLWYRVNTDITATQSVQIALCGTGHPCPASFDGKYIGTVLLHGGSLVLHAFARRP